ncbi:MAG: outer membrane lipoprotein-sorting protein [Treponema sp.]|nr:outer membrane lipoprotein-sorting protein [Treponema sp.]
MNKRIIPITLLLVVAGIAFSQTPSAAALLKQVDDNEIYKTIQYEADMIIDYNGRRYVKTMKTWARQNTDSFVEFTNSEDRGTRYLKKGGRLYVYSPDTEQVTLISGHMLKESMMGSDLSYEDAIDNEGLSARYDPVLAGSGTWSFSGTNRFPDMKFLVFAAAPKDPLTPGGDGARAGLSWDSHWQRASIQLLYCFESPASYSAFDPVYPVDFTRTLYDEYPQGLHRAGFSFKADLELGFTAELLYTINPDKNTGINGLAASAGVDYSFYGGKLYLLAEYLFSGSKSAEAKSAAMPLGHTGSHYLYAGGTWKWSDFSSITLSCLANLEDISFIPLVFWQYEFIQSVVLSIRSYVPLDKDSFKAGKPGEFGPGNSGSNFYITAGLKVKF